MAFSKHDSKSRGSASADSSVTLFGIHAVEAALRNPARTIRTLLLTDNAERRLADALAHRKVKAHRALPRDLDRRLGADTVHQGAFLETEALPEPTLAELAATAEGGRPLVVLDQVTDPHNVGAILRSAAAFGAAGLVTTRRHSPPLAGSLAKSASGALEVVPIALVPNLAQALDAMKQEGLTVVGLDGEAPQLIDDYPIEDRVALVFGAEGRGLRRLTRELCDALCRIGMEGGVASLNVSNAAAVALHTLAVRRRRRGV
jgi:23S rRNA (guanosine2251-2'-O)-methyltransferase